jgi:hypothetical protein
MMAKNASLSKRHTLWIALILVSLSSNDALAAVTLLDGHQNGINWPRIIAGIIIGLLAVFAAIALILHRNGRPLLPLSWANTQSPGQNPAGGSMNLWGGLFSTPRSAELTVLEHKRLTATCEVIRFCDLDQEYLIAVVPGCIQVLRQQEANRRENQLDKRSLEAVTSSTRASPDQGTEP